MNDESKIISKHDFYFETPLYDIIAFDELEEGVFLGDVDGYNTVRGCDTTFSIASTRLQSNYYEDYFNFYRVTLKCKRYDTDKLRFFIFCDGERVVKIGQYPSLADIQFAEIGKKYDKHLSKEHLFEFKRAIGLAANGVGVGSFVYLRRIFENLIKEAFNENKHSLKIDEDTFKAKRMPERVVELKDFLPSQLVEMKKVYSVLSDGIHNLSEEDCLQYFSVLKLSIELIIDQKIEIALKQKRDEEVKKQVAALIK